LENFYHEDLYEFFNEKQISHLEQKDKETSLGGENMDEDIAALKEANFNR
jgi:hypothetical protein